MLGIFLGVLAIALGYLAAFLPGRVPAAAPWLMGAGLCLLLVSLIALGARRSRRRAPALLIAGLAFTALVLAGGFGAALLLPPETAATPLLLGLPRRAALLVYGIGILPLLVLPLVYAFSFDATVMSEAELAAWRARLAELQRDRKPG